MKTKVVVKRYAVVEDGIWEYRVHENGDMERWDDELGWMEYYDEDEVKEAGMKALEETK